MDLADVAGNTADGVHVAATGGAWMALVYGFAGLRDFDGMISFDPCLPQEWTGLRVPLRVRGQRLDVDLNHERLVLTLRRGRGLDVTVRGEAFKVSREEPVTVDLEPHRG